MTLDNAVDRYNERVMSNILSLDFWGTIAVFNPQYAAARTRLFADRFQLPDDEAHARYQYIKRHCDHQAETFGSGVTPLVAVKRMLEGMNIKPSVDAVSILEDIEELVRRFPPLLDRRVAPRLTELRGSGEWKIGVASNTNFIRGSLVAEIFPNLHWDFAVYSDEVGVSKPDPDFFRTVMLQARIAAKDRSIAPRDMIHIGDNSACDVRGPERVGMRAALTKSPDETVAMLERLIRGGPTALPTG